MPRIPDAQSLGRRPLPNAQQPVVNDRSGQIVASAIGDLGESISRTAGVLQEREDQFTYARAKSAFLQADIAARRSLENDQDYGTHETRYQEAMKKAHEASSAMIRSPRDKAAFGLEVGLDLARGSAAIGSNARKIEVDVSRGQLLESLAANRDQGLLATDEATRASFLKTSAELISGGEKRGYLGHAEAEKLRQETASDYAEAFVSTLDPEEQIAYLTDTGTNLSEHISPDRKAVMLKQAERYARIDRTSQAAEAEQALNRQQRYAADEAWKVIAAGGKVKSIPPGVWKNLDGRMQVQLQDYEEAQVNGEKIATNWDTYYELRELAVNKPDEFATTDLRLFRNQLSDTDFKQFVDRQTSTSTAEGKLDARTFDQQLSTHAALFKLKGEDLGKFQSAAGTAVTTEQRRLRRELTYEERQKVLDRLTVEGDWVVPGAWYNPTRRAYEVADKTDEGYFVAEGDTFDPTKPYVFGSGSPADTIPAGFFDIPEEERAKISEALTTANLRVTPAAIFGIWEKAQAKKAAK